MCTCKYESMLKNLISTIHCSLKGYLFSVESLKGITRKLTDKSDVIANLNCMSCFCTSNTLILLSEITAWRMAMTVGCLSVVG